MTDAILYPGEPVTTGPQAPALVTLDNCAREPIHIPGAIQAHGALVAFEPASGSITFRSTNLGHWLPVGELPVTGRSLLDLVGEPAYRLIAAALHETAGPLMRHRLIDLPARPEAGQPLALQVAVHNHRGICIAEFELAPPAASERDWMQLLGDAVDGLRTARHMGDLVERAARRVKVMTALDRVMVYRFDADWSGHVVADAREPDMPSYFDLHYPASDIPAQARELYRTNLVRYIADVGYVPVPVRPWFDPERREPLDLSHSLLRSVSPMHTQYLSNMGVRSTLTLSLIVDGALWGLIACHHRLPTALPLRLRRACHTLSATAGYVVSWRQERDRVAASAAALLAQGVVLEAFNHVQAPLSVAVDESAGALLDMHGAVGGAFWQGSELLAFGQWPGGERGEAIVRLVRHTLEISNDDLYSTERIELQPPLDPVEMRQVCGLLAIRLDVFATSGIVWLRPEFRREVAWGGDPDKPVQIERDANGEIVLSPRSSFARWEALVRGRCRSWSAADLDAARALRPLRQILVMRDSLAQVSLSDRRFRGLVALQSDAYWQIDGQGVLIALSKPLPTAHGPTQGKTLVDLLSPSCTPAALHGLAIALAGELPFRHLRVAGKTVPDGRAFLLELNGEPLRNGNVAPVGWHGTVNDVTIESEMHDALRQKQVAESANLAKTQFLSQISHELRTPLNAVMGFSQLLLADPALSPRQLEQVSHIHRAGGWLLAMISDLLDLSRIETGNLSLNMAVVDARATLTAALGWVGKDAADSGITLIADDGTAPVWVHADGLRLQQALVNLATNAVKYNHAGGEVRFILRQDPDAAKILIEVHDTGVGLTAEQIGQLFQPFNRLGRESLRIQGTGIGLVISQQMVQAMGGRILVRSTPDVGSCFSIELTTARMPSTPSARPPTAAAHLTVLYVEDDLINATLIQAVVDSLPGVSFVHAETAEDGLRLARALKPAITLIDINLAGKPGTWLLAALRADPELRDSRCIAVTASDRSAAGDAALTAQFDDWWTKPLNLQTVRGDLHKLLRGVPQRPQ